MKLINAGLKSAREMMEHLILKGDLYYKESGARFYFSEAKAKDCYACFFIAHTDGTTSEIKGYWDIFKDMEKEMTLEDAVKAGKRVVCWWDKDKTSVCIVVSFNGEDKVFVSSGGAGVKNPVPIEPDELF